MGGPKWGVGYYEWYSRDALERYEPCETCSPEYRAAYGRLQGLVEGADALFERAYTVLSELSRINPNPEIT